MEFLKCRDVRWKGPEKRNKPNVVDWQYHWDLRSVNSVCSHVTLQFDFSSFPVRKMHNEPITYADYWNLHNWTLE